MAEEHREKDAAQLVREQEQAEKDYLKAQKPKDLEGVKLHIKEHPIEFVANMIIFTVAIVALLCIVIVVLALLTYFAPSSLAALQVFVYETYLRITKNISDLTRFIVKAFNITIAAIQSGNISSLFWTGF